MTIHDICKTVPFKTRKTRKTRPIIPIRHVKHNLSQHCKVFGAYSAKHQTQLTVRL